MDLEEFTIKKTIAHIESILENKPNHCDYDFLYNLARELQSILEDRKREEE